MIDKTQHVKSFFDKPDIYLRKSFGISMRALIVRGLLGELEGSTILDLGCGDGRVSIQYLSLSNRITLVDLSEKMLEKARLNTPGTLSQNVAYLNTDFHKLTFDSTFDVVLCIGVLAHVASVNETIASIARFLRPNGRCVLQLTDDQRAIAKIERFYRSLANNGHSYGYSINRTTPLDVIAVAEDNGLKTIDSRRFSLLLPGMGKLPDEWLYGYQMYTLNNSFLSRHGSEVILLLEKTADSV